MRDEVSQFAQQLLRWYDRHARDLPWRRPPSTSDPYHILISEAMLQQTQVATVIPYFERFISRFPTLKTLAEADEQDVLRLWQGLGYYSRARNLREAARTVMSAHGGELPRTAVGLLSLPGVGRYTAGAVASIAFGCRAPIVDGNVARVLCRLDRIEGDPREKAATEQLWRRAEEILPRKRCGDFNSALMELGATVCTPRNPKCLLCPVQANCEAFAAGMQERIPPPRKAIETPLLRRDVLCIARGGRWLIEQRPAKGRWAGMWQFITVESGKSRQHALKSGRRIGTVTHALTHRRYEFRVFHGELLEKSGTAANGTPRAWVTLKQLDRYPLSRPHLKIAEMLREQRETSS
jgi:A/G-specific adenine glycosylase